MPNCCVIFSVFLYIFKKIIILVIIKIIILVPSNFSKIFDTCIPSWCFANFGAKISRSIYFISIECYIANMFTRYVNLLYIISRKVRGNQKKVSRISNNHNIKKWLKIFQKRRLIFWISFFLLV